MDPPMENRDKQAEQAIQKRQKDPDAVVKRLKKKLEYQRKWLAEFMQMSAEEKRKEMTSVGFRRNRPFEDYINREKNNIASLEKTIAKPRTKDVLPYMDTTTLWRGIIFIALQLVFTPTFFVQG